METYEKEAGIASRPGSGSALAGSLSKALCIVHDLKSVAQFYTDTLYIRYVIYVYYRSLCTVLLYGM